MLINPGRMQADYTYGRRTSFKSWQIDGKGHLINVDK